MRKRKLFEIAPGVLDVANAKPHKHTVCMWAKGISGYIYLGYNVMRIQGTVRVIRIENDWRPPRYAQEKTD